jgi:hypothetical protein
MSDAIPSTRTEENTAAPAEPQAAGASRPAPEALISASSAVSATTAALELAVEGTTPGVDALASGNALASAETPAAAAAAAAGDLSDDEQSSTQIGDGQAGEQGAVVSNTNFKWFEKYNECECEEERAKGPPPSNRFICVSLSFFGGAAFFP